MRQVLRYWSACFNTQPPEGGWHQVAHIASGGIISFNTQPPEGGWLGRLKTGEMNKTVSTHSRLKAAGGKAVKGYCWLRGFNTQPPEGGWI